MTTITRNPTDPAGYRLTSRARINRPLDEVFAFFADAGNLEEITPPWLHFSYRSPLPIEMKEGALIDYRLRLHHVPIRWRTRIASWEPPLRFVDEQLRGPFRYWRHEHRFVEQSGVTIVSDRVDYAVYGGRLVHRLFVQSDLRRIFAYRRRKLAERFRAKPRGVSLHA